MWFALALVPASQAQAALPGWCDQDVPAVEVAAEPGGLAYGQQSPDRCEGLLAHEHEARLVEVVGVIRDCAGPGAVDLHLTWAGSSATKVSARAVDGLNYAMDARVGVGQNALQWPGEQRRSAGVHSLGAAAWSDEGRELWPVTLSDAPDISCMAPFVVYIRAVAHLEALGLKLVPAGGMGPVEAEPLKLESGGAFFPAGAAVGFELPMDIPPGTWSLKPWFQLQGDPRPRAAQSVLLHLPNSTLPVASGAGDRP